MLNKSDNQARSIGSWQNRAHRSHGTARTAQTAEELGVAYYDDDHLKSFNKDKKRIKKWGTSVTNNFIASSLGTRLTLTCLTSP